MSTKSDPSRAGLSSFLLFSIKHFSVCIPCFVILYYNTLGSMQVSMPMLVILHTINVCFLHSIPGAGANIIIIFSSFFFCSIFPIFHTKPYTPHTNFKWLYIITYAYTTVDITVLCSCRVLASMYTHYNTILCSRVNLTGKAHYYLLLVFFFRSLFNY